MSASIERFFVGAGSIGQPRIVMAASSRDAAGLQAHRRDTKEAPPEYNAVLITIGGAIPRRMWTALTLRIRIARSVRQLRSLGAVSVRTFAAVPDIDHPTILYELGTPAGRYAVKNLRLDHPRFRAARSLLGKIMGCDPAAGSICVVGKLR